MSSKGNTIRKQAASRLLRRSPRVPVRISVHLVIDNEAPVPAMTADISRQGGMILSPVEVRPNKQLWIQNQLNHHWAKVRVVSVHSNGLVGDYALAVEFDGDGQSCWAETYEELLKPSGVRNEKRMPAELPAGLAPRRAPK
jgi:PilZ domain